MDGLAQPFARQSFMQSVCDDRGPTGGEEEDDDDNDIIALPTRTSHTLVLACLHGIV